MEERKEARKERKRKEGREKENVETDLNSFTKINSKQIIHLTENHEIRKLIADNMGENFSEFYEDLSVTKNTFETISKYYV